MDDIIRFVEDKAGPTIHYSSLALAEIRPSHFKGTHFKSALDFFEDLGPRFVQIEANPNVMVWAGELRDSQSTNPYPKATTTRVFSTPDAIQLMTCIYARDVLDVKDIVFQTLDQGKGKTWEGKCIPLLGIEEWFPEPTRTERLKTVCGLTRQKPYQAQGTLAGVVAHGKSFNTQPGDQDRAH
ncbi:hypothetical protein NKI48_16460 [Mesorhizobium sp. M0644]|uniref:hypothetical protein n=1 Tax=unclassified Mesorhizobium TaxID=325217 RepID=UPI003336CB45